MQICQHCQARVEDGAAFCDQCGHELGVTPERLERAARATPVPAGTQSPQPRASAAPLSGAARVATATQPPERQAPNPALVVALHLSIGQRIPLSGQSEYVIGRASATAPRPDVDLGQFYSREAGISRHHIKICVEADGCFVEDLNSTNETVQNGFRLMPEQRYPLHNGDELRLGSTVLYVTIEPPPSR
jgi:hypothetical protein